MGRIVATAIAAIPMLASASVQVTDSRVAFVASTGPQLEVEDWTSYVPETLLDGQTVRGVTYASTSAELLVVGAPHGASWILGYSRGGGRYASFSFETITFQFTQPVSAFGIALSQGNRSGGTSYDGSSQWQAVVDGGVPGYLSLAEYSVADFTGEAYLGLTGLANAMTVSVTRMRSDANIVWDIREISWVSTVPEPWSAMLALAGLALVAHRTSRHTAET